MKPVPLSINGVQVAELTSVGWDDAPAWPTRAPEPKTWTVSVQCTVPPGVDPFAAFRHLPPPATKFALSIGDVCVPIDRIVPGKLRRRRKGGVEQAFAMYRNWPRPKPGRAPWREKRARRRAKAAARRDRLRSTRLAHQVEHRLRMDHRLRALKREEFGA